jgi:hypothetical protein
MTPSPQLVSNEIEDFAEGGGLYPGGTGFLEEVSYRLWDYNGTKPKDSFCAAYIRFRPIDGSNQGKVVEQYYSIASSSDYVPDPTGGHLLSLKGAKPKDSTNWGHFLKVLRDNCGLEKGRLSTNSGIRVMERGIVTLVQVDQLYQGDDQLPATQLPPGQAAGKKPYKHKTLIPTRAVFHWDPNYANVTRNVQMPPPPPQQGAYQPPPPQFQQPAYQPPPPPQQQFQPPPPNGAPAPMAQAPVQQSAPMANGDYSLASVIRSLLAENGGSLSVSQLPAQVLHKLAPPIDRTIRVNVSKESKDLAMLAAIAQANGWTLSGDDLIG